MSLVRAIVRVVLPICILLFARVALAGPARCSYGNQDSTCTTPIVAAWQPQPQCTGDGMTTQVPAVWQGAQWSAPQCNYTPAPTCPNGFIQTSAPSWTGSSWTAPGCTLPYIPPPTFEPTASCTAAVPYGYTASTGFTYNSGYSDPSWAAQTGYPGDTAYVASGYGPGYQNICGNTHYDYGLVCYVSPSNIGGWYMVQTSINTCGGTH